MKALYYDTYGPPDVLRFDDLPVPEPGSGEVLVRVCATSVNRTDNATIQAIPFLARLVTGVFRPKRRVPGTEFAGVVEKTGPDCGDFKAGERVFGFDDQGTGAHAEYLVAPGDRMISIPEGIDFGQAAAGIEGLHYALNCINKTGLREGDRALVYGASGAIGSAAVQLLRHSGVSVTAVCGTEAVERVRALGADQVIDYQKEDFVSAAGKHRFVLDSVGRVSFRRCWPLLEPGGVYISNDLGYLAQNVFLPLITRLIRPLLGGRHCRSPIPFNIPRSLRLARDLLESGGFRPLYDRTFPFENIVEAYRYVGRGQKIGNVVISLENGS